MVSLGKHSELQAHGSSWRPAGAARPHLAAVLQMAAAVCTVSPEPRAPVSVTRTARGLGAAAGPQGWGGRCASGHRATGTFVILALKQVGIQGL